MPGKMTATEIHRLINQTQDETLPTGRTVAARAPDPPPSPMPPVEPTRLSVRPKASVVLTAAKLKTEQLLTLTSGQRRMGYPGDWVVAHHDHVVDVMSAHVFEQLYEPANPGLVVSRDLQEELEEVLEVGACRTALSLVKAVKRLAVLKIGGVQVDFTPSQLEEIAHRADKNGHSFQQELERVVERLSGDVFWTV